MRNFCVGFFVASAIWLAWHGNAQVSVSVYGVSRHSEPHYCEQNPGIGINYQLADSLRFSVSEFKNSKCRMTNAIGFVYDPIHLGKFRVGLAFLRLTGYRDEAVYAPLPVGSYWLQERLAIDFFALAKGDLAVAGAGLRFVW